MHSRCFERRNAFSFVLNGRPNIVAAYIEYVHVMQTRIDHGEVLEWIANAMITITTAIDAAPSI